MNKIKIHIFDKIQWLINSYQMWATFELFHTIEYSKFWPAYVWAMIKEKYSDIFDSEYL